MDEGKQPLTDAEAQQLQHEQEVQQAEAQTGSTPIPRTVQTEDPQNVDPRFDKDDLRQGKPPPAMKKHRKLHIRRKRANKGAPLTKEEKAKAAQGGAAAAAAADDEAEMTDEEVDLTDDEVDLGAIDSTDDNEKKSGGLLSKVLGKS